jgi:DHA1 family multidrug resistance protein-like MFS transporter
MLYAIAGAGMLGHGLFRPILPIFARRRAITAFIIGKNIDRSGKRKIFVKIGFFCVFIIAFTYFFVNSYYGLFFLRFCQGICSGFMWPATQIMVAEEAEKSYKARALSLYQIFGRIGALLSKVILGLILLITINIGLGELSSFRVVFIVGGIILFIGFVEVLLMPEHKKVKVEKRKGKPPHPIFLLGFVIGAMLALAPLSLVYMNEHYNITPLGIAILLLCLDVITIFVMYGSSHLTDLIGIKKSLLIIIIPCFVTAVFLPFISYFLAFIVFYFIMRMSISSFIPISRAYATDINTEVGSNIGTLNMVTNLGSVVGPIIGGLIYDTFPGVFKIAGYSFVALLLIPGIFLFLKKTDRIDKV